MPDFTKSDFNVIKWLIDELEDRFTLVFETVVSEDRKKEFLYQVDHLFNSAELLVNEGDVRVRKELDELSDEISSGKEFLKKTDNLSGFFWERLTTKWYLFKRKRTKFLIVRILAMYFSEHPEVLLKNVKKKKKAPSVSLAPLERRCLRA